MAKKLEYGLAMYDRWEGGVDYHIKMPMEGVRSGGSIIEFLESAAENGWELCATLPGTTAGSRRQASAKPGGTRTAESDHEVVDMVFKRHI